MIHSAIAPEKILTKVKLAGSVAVRFSAARQRSELLANAIMANEVRMKTRAFTSQRPENRSRRSEIYDALFAFKREGDFSYSVTGRPGGIMFGRRVKRSKRPKKHSSSKQKRTKINADRSRHVSAGEFLRATEAVERKTAELALSLSMMQATLDSTTDAIVVTDLKGDVRNFNEKYCEMMGVTRAQLKEADVNKLRLKFSERFKDRRPSYRR